MATVFRVPTVFEAIDKLTRPFQKMVGTVTSGSSRMEASMARMGRATDSAYKKLNIFPRLNSAMGILGLSVGIAGVTGAVRKFVTEATKMEDARAAFQGLLGGSDAARDLVMQLNRLGARTPFEFSDLASAAQVMIGFGAATQNNVIEKLQMVGDLAQGNAERLGGITLAFSQIRAAGKASMQDINQLINQGVPILGQLASQWKMSVGAAREAVSKGRASAKEIERAFMAMTGKGGMFFNGMAIASSTLSGKISTLKDAINMAFASVGETALPIIKQYVEKISQAINKVGDWAAKNQDLIRVRVVEWLRRVGATLGWLIDHIDGIVRSLKWYVGLLVALRALSLLTAGAQIITAAATFLLSKEVRAARLAQLGLNAAILANPMTWFILAIVAVVGYIAWLISKTEGWREQWHELWRFMVAQVDYWRLSFLLYIKTVEIGFSGMVDAVIKSWKWLQNKLGLLSDQQYIKDLRQIEAEKVARIRGAVAYRDALKKATAEANKPLQNKLRWRSEHEDSPGLLNGLISALSGTATPVGDTLGSPTLPALDRVSMTQLVRETLQPKQQPIEILLRTDKDTTTEIRKKPDNILIRTTSTTAQFGF